MTNSPTDTSTITLSELATLPEGVNETLQLIERFDSCLLHGFSRLGPEQKQSLAALAAALNRSPLGPSIAAAVEATLSSQFTTRHFLALASGRAALQGCLYDALTAQLNTALGRQVIEPDPSALAVAGSSASPLAATQHWLMEIALAGFAHLIDESVHPFMPTLEQLQADPDLGAVAAMTTGFVNELSDHLPTERQPTLPVFRWSDLWTATMIGTQAHTRPSVGRQFSGPVTLLGTDMQSHGNFVQAAVYGLIECDGEPKAVRLPFSAFKVDALNGHQLWQLFGESIEPTLRALQSHKQIKVDEAELTADGDLLLAKKPRVGAAADPFTMAAHFGPLPAARPLLRHPIQIAELVHVRADDTPAWDTTRLPATTELTAKVLAKADEIIGLARFDSGSWRIQPLAARSAKGFVKGEAPGTIISGQGAVEGIAKLRSKSLAILTERADKLLRQK